MLISTTEELQGYEITEYLGLVHGEIVSGANILRDVMATVTDLYPPRSVSWASSTSTFQPRPSA